MEGLATVSHALVPSKLNTAMRCMWGLLLRQCETSVGTEFSSQSLTGTSCHEHVTCVQAALLVTSVFLGSIHSAGFVLAFPRPLF